MAGQLTFDELKKAVAEGRIDTVLACIVDMQGRLIGKRFYGQFSWNPVMTKPTAAIIFWPTISIWNPYRAMRRRVGTKAMAISS